MFLKKTLCFNGFNISLCQKLDSSSVFVAFHFYIAFLSNHLNFDICKGHMFLLNIFSRSMFSMAMYYWVKLFQNDIYEYERIKFKRTPN